MTKLLSQLDKMPLDALPAGRPTKPQRSSRGPGFRAVATLMVWVLIIGGVVYLTTFNRGDGKQKGLNIALGGDTNQSSSDRVGPGGSYPTVGVGEKKQRILPAAAIPAGKGGYQFIETNDDGTTPVAYDPCRPIHYAIRDRGTPAGGDVAVRNSIAEVSKATGLKFIEDAPTTEVPIDRREDFQPKLYGDRWAPVLIAWSDPAESPRLASGVAGYAGSSSFFVAESGNPKRVYVTGELVLDAPQLAKEPAELVTAVVQHELGHLVGLNHVTDKTQIMFPAASEKVTSFGAGDLRGLARLGRGSCHPEV